MVRGETPGALGGPFDGAGGRRQEGGRTPHQFGLSACWRGSCWVVRAGQPGTVRIEFWVFHRQAPLILVIVISGLLGALITVLLMRRKPKPEE